MAVPSHPMLAAVTPARNPEAHKLISGTMERRIALFEPASAMIEALGKPMKLVQPFVHLKYHHGWDLDAEPISTGMELPNPTMGLEETKNIYSEVTLVRGMFQVDFQNILEETMTSQDSTISPETDSLLNAFERKAEQQLDIFMQLKARWFLRGDFNVEGKIGTAKEAKLLRSIRTTTTIWGEDSTVYRPSLGSVNRPGLLRFATPAAQAIAAEAPYGLTRYVGTDDDVGWYNEFIECVGPDTLHRNLQRLAARMSRDPHFLAGHVPDIAYADDETILQQAELVENRVLHVMDSAAPTPGLPKRSAELILQFAKEQGRATHIMQFGPHKLPVYSTPAYIYSADTKIQELGGIMVALCTKDWVRLQFAQVLNRAIMTGGVKFFPQFQDSQFAIGEFVQDPQRRLSWQQDWMYCEGHIVEQLRTHFTVKGTVAVDDVS